MHPALQQCVEARVRVGVRVRVRVRGVHPALQQGIEPQREERGLR